MSFTVCATTGQSAVDGDETGGRDVMKVVDHLGPAAVVPVDAYRICRGCFAFLGECWLVLLRLLREFLTEVPVRWPPGWCQCHSRQTQASQ
jgi:hypothetical protein